ncbi:hypothetical protein ACA910_003047 [Epithemia clementina (nom. ined.)]
MTALDVWNKMRGQMKDIDLGTMVLHRMFELQPKAKDVFGYNVSEEVGQAQTSVHALSLVCLFDSIFQMLGPDIEFAQTMLAQIASKHKAMGVAPSFFPYMGQAFIETFIKVLGRASLPDNAVEAWEELYETISNEIVRNILVN